MPEPPDVVRESNNPVGIVTGGASGIGRATALRFAAIGARVVVADLSAEAATKTVREIETAGGSAVACGTDIRDAAMMDDLAKTAVDTYGRIDFVVACAGAVDQSTIPGGDPDRWRRVIDTNLTGTLLTIRSVLPYLLAQGSGHVFIVASMAGRGAHTGEPAYIASKWGEVGFGAALRLEVEAANIRVTLVEPGLVDTPFTHGNPKVELMKQSITPLSPDDVARAMVFAFEQPQHVCIDEIALRPVGQAAAASAAVSQLAAQAGSTQKG